MARKTAAEKEAEAEALEAEDLNGDGSTIEDPAQADEVEPTGVQAAEDEALDDLGEAPDDYEPGGDFTSYEDTAPPDSEPGNDAQRTLDAATERENAQIKANQLRYERRTSGLSSAEVNAIEASEKEEAKEQG